MRAIAVENSFGFVLQDFIDLKSESLPSSTSSSHI